MKHTVSIWYGATLFTHFLSFLYHHKEVDTCDIFFLFPHREFWIESTYSQVLDLKIIHLGPGKHYILNYHCSRKP